MKSLTSTASNVALAAGGLVGLAGLAGAQTSETYNVATTGTVVSFTPNSSAEKALASGYGSDLVFDLNSGVVQVSAVGTTSSPTAPTSTDPAQSFELDARTLGTAAGQSLGETGEASNASGTSTSGLLDVNTNTDNMIANLASGATIGGQTAQTSGTSSSGTGDVFLIGANNSFLNKKTGSNSTFPVTGSGPAGTGETGYIGFTFADPFISGQQDYGWANITLDAAGDITLNSFAYDDSGATIKAGATGATAASPEPTSVGMLLLGGAALAYLARRSRKESLTA